MSDDNYKEGETLIGRHGDRSSDEGNGEFQIELQSQNSGQFHTDIQAGHGKFMANCYVITAAVMASLGGVLFGYDIGIISGAILQLRDVFCLSCLDQELVISAMLMGAIVGSMFGGFFIDHYGRRLTIIVNAGIFLVGALILGFSPNFAVLVVGRILLGFAVSVSATGECIYISEIAPANRRGLLVSLNELGITLGLLLAYLCNFLFIEVNNGWRWMFVLSAIPAIIQGIGMVFLPPSPRYLMIKKREIEAEAVLQKLRGVNRVDRELSGIRVSVASEKNQGCMDLCGNEEGIRGRMLIGIGLVFFQQFTGQPNVLYYAPTIFEEIGFKSDSAATLATLGLGVVKVVMTILAVLCVDRFGRRRLLMVGAVMMGISIFTLGIICHFQNEGTNQNTCVDSSHCHTDLNYTSSTHLPLTKLEIHSTLFTSNISNTQQTSVFTHPDSGPFTTATVLYSNITQSNTQNDSAIKGNDSEMLHGNAGKGDNSDIFTGSVTKGGNFNISSDDGEESLHKDATKIQRYLGFAALMAYVAAFAFSFGPVTWLVLSEIFPAAVKGRAIALATVFNWGTNLVVTFTFLDVMNALGTTWTFTLFAIICAVSVIFIFSFVPETKNKTLEQISTEMKSRSLITRMRLNCAGLFCCCSSRTSMRNHGNYRRVEAETVT